MDQEAWELVEVLFLHRVETLRGAMEALEKAVPVAAYPPMIGDFWRKAMEPEKGRWQVFVSPTSDGVSTNVECDSFSPGDDLMLGIGRQAQ